jgi:hypothetical protein
MSVTGRGGPWYCETSQLSLFIDNRLTYGGKVFRPTRPSTIYSRPRKVPGTHFCQRTCILQGRSVAIRKKLEIRKIRKIQDLGNRTHYLPAFSTVSKIHMSYELRMTASVSGQSSWLLTQRSRVRFPVLPDFLSSSGSGTESTQPL